MKPLVTRRRVVWLTIKSVNAFRHHTLCWCINNHHWKALTSLFGSRELHPNYLLYASFQWWKWCSQLKTNMNLQLHPVEKLPRKWIGLEAFEHAGSHLHVGDMQNPILATTSHNLTDSTCQMTIIKKVIYGVAGKPWKYKFVPWQFCNPWPGIPDTLPRLENLYKHGSVQSDTPSPGIPDTFRPLCMWDSMVCQAELGVTFKYLWLQLPLGLPLQCCMRCLNTFSWCSRLASNNSKVYRHPNAHIANVAVAIMPCAHATRYPWQLIINIIVASFTAPFSGRQSLTWQPVCQPNVTPQ